MEWKIKDNQLFTEYDEIIWCVRDKSQFKDHPTGKYIAHRMVGFDGKNGLEDGFLSSEGYVIENIIAFVKGFDTPDSAIFDNIIDAIKICEQDKENIENGITRNYIDPEMEALKNSTGDGWRPEHFYFAIIVENKPLELWRENEKETIIAFVTKWDWEQQHNVCGHPHGYHDFVYILPKELEHDLDEVDGCLYVYIHTDHRNYRDLLNELGFTEKPEMAEQIRKIYKLIYKKE